MDSHCHLLQFTSSGISCPPVNEKDSIFKDRSVNDNESLVTVRRQGPPVLSLDSGVKTVNRFSGRENTLTMSRVHSTQWLCHYDIANYPFDSQICFLVFAPAGISKMFCKLKSGNFIYSGASELPQYFVRWICPRRSLKKLFIVLGPHQCLQDTQGTQWR